VLSANEILEEVLGQAADLVTADWSEGQDEMSRPIVILTLRDFTGSVFTRFAPDELTNPDHMRRRLHRLWGDLLQIRVRTHVKSLQELVQSVEVN
jgi:hypothetical protein